ncbi:glycosyl hydrolase [candidate division KSB1 bacterium]|nr:glycosyl hydrolase [candidate division KSB1 bacterium]NIR73293.1 glycosyl hydrolase [candidate division KSB1 bacterium]NIS26999.1 glycosyl hydrolase [candidate division KSB1 bacterium]NIT73839.1 glycosyl hydrolase [candidate division KSB1 bacterium]NIU27744.1 glycosyl hydrolase [candidate division KSB1 bacterium]
MMCVLILAVALFWVPDSYGQEQITYDESLYNALEYRDIGPYRGGRSAAVAGVPDDPMTYYFGGTGGGVWKTDNGGKTWENISDGFFGGSIGAVAVSEWDPNVIYVGGGEKTVRGNVSHGYGMWKSTDAGKTWKQMGLQDSRHIPRIRIHPKNPDLVYAAVLGHLFGPNEERGVYRSRDGGQNWERILFVSNEAGAVDLAMDPTNPRILFASFWRIKRTPYSLESGGTGSSIWKSTDGGDTWEEITSNEGLPQGVIGISGLTISPVNPNRIWAIIEAKHGGVFRSEDGGETWRKVNEERKLRQRAWYYTRIYADTQNEDRVYVLNVRFWRSKDGGKTFESIRTPHGDHHDLWIAPENSHCMILGDDGGAQITFNGGESWTTYHNQPTAQFYRVTTDNHFPYRIYGAQQDNSTVRILHRSSGRTIDERDWEPTAGGESGWLAPHPVNPDIVYGGSYGGFLMRLNHETHEFRSINVWPDNPMGHGAEGMKYRFQWNFPILFSRYDPNTLYTAGNVLFKTTNGGESWEAISPDLTRNDSTKLGPSGGPITKDNTGVEYYCTIFTVAESLHEPGVIWTGSDDGLIHLTRDGGKTWENVTPPKKIMPEWIQINSIEAHPFEPGGLYVAATMYKWDDFRPSLYKTTDYGKSWKKITKGIDDQHFTRVVGADPQRQGLLYAGTESGMYLSFDDGEHWQPFQLNLPVVPITDLALKENDLIVATQGRSFWVLDDLTPLHQLSEDVAKSEFWLYEPRASYRLRGRARESKTAGQNLPNGVMIHYYFQDAPDSSAVALKILEDNGNPIKTFTPKAEEKDELLPIEKGMNRFRWDMRYADAEKFKNLIMWAGSVTGPKAAPGTFQARLMVGDDSSDVAFEILKDPRSRSTRADLHAQFDFLIAIRDKLTETHRGIKQIRQMRSQIKDVISKLAEQEGAERIKESGEELIKKITQIEETLYQTKNESRQDPLNFPIRLNNKLAALARTAAMGDYRPTEQALAVKKELTARIDAELTKLRTVLETDLPAFNELVHEKAIPAVKVDTGKTKKAEMTTR